MLEYLSTLIDDVQEREQRNRYIAAAILTAGIISAGFLFMVCYQWYPRWIAAAALAIAFLTLLWAQRSSADTTGNTP
jgi:CHASE2 domain-containing sensor protein